MDGASNVDPGEQAGPVPGDLTVCAYCSTLLRFVEGLAVRELRPDELQVLKRDERHALLTAQKAIRRNPFPLRGQS
jgi:hypothetical protein